MIRSLITYHRPTAFAALILAALSLTASAETIASQGNPSPSFPTGLSVAADEALEVSWTAINSYNNVSISVSLGQLSALPADGTAYLMTQIGETATSANQIASAGFTFPNQTGGDVTLFSNLSMSPGTYYVVLYSTSDIGGGWLFSQDPSLVTAPGVTIGASGYYYNPGVSVFGDFPYAPDLPFSPTYDEDLVFSVTGNSLSSAVPEPSGLSLLLLAALVTCSITLARGIDHARN